MSSNPPRTVTCRFPSAWTLLQALPISQLDYELTKGNLTLMTARCRAQLALSFLDDASQELADDNRSQAIWFREDAKALADEALELMLRDADRALDEEQTHG